VILSASHGVCVPSAYHGSGSPLSPGVPLPGTFRPQGFYLLGGLLLPNPPRFVSPWNARGILPSELSLPRKGETPLGVPSPPAVTATLHPWLGRQNFPTRVGELCAVRLQGVALSRSPFTRVRGLAKREVGALLGFSSSGLPPLRSAPPLRERSSLGVRRLSFRGILLPENAPTGSAGSPSEFCSVGRLVCLSRDRLPS